MSGLQVEHPPVGQVLDASELEHVECVLCGADDAETVLEAKAPGRGDLNRTFRASADEPLVDRLVRCRQCGLEHVNPRPRASAIVEAYSVGEDPTYVSQVEARERTFRSALVRIEKMQPTRGRLLDIGTAAGAFLAAARTRGWQVEGCEPNRWLVEWGTRHYGIPIRVGEVFDQAYGPGSFDAVTLWDVIEHTPDPSRVIATVATILKPGGLLVINYPDIGSWIARLMGQRWPFLSSVHLFYFTRTTIRLFLERHGFEIIEMRPHIQRLELGYLLARRDVLSRGLSSALGGLARAIGLSRRQVPYWIGQTFVAARRR